MAMIKVTWGVGTGEDKDRKKLTYTEVNHSLKLLLNEAIVMFGGASGTNVNGGWLNPNNEIVLEHGVEFTTTIKDTEENRVKIRLYSVYLAKAFNQEAVVEIIQPVTSFNYVGQDD